MLTPTFHEESNITSCRVKRNLVRHDRTARSIFRLSGECIAIYANGGQLASPERFELSLLVLETSVLGR